MAQSNASTTRLTPDWVDDTDEIAELIVSEVSLFLRQRYYDSFPYSYVLGPVRGARLERTSPADVELQARNMIADLVPRLVQVYGQSSAAEDGELKDLMSDDEMETLSRVVAESGGDQARLEAVLSTGEFLTTLPTIIGRVVRQYPQVFLDGQLFSLPYSTLPQSLAESDRQEFGMENAGRVASLLDDIVGVLRRQSFQSRQLQVLSRKRVANSLDLIREILVAT